MVKSDFKAFGKVRNIKNKDDYTLLTEARELKAVSKYFGNPRWFDFKGCYVKEKGGRYTEVYCYSDSLVNDDTAVFEVVKK
jgi:hypothetical protein